MKGQTDWRGVAGNVAQALEMPRADFDRIVAAHTEEVKCPACLELSCAGCGLTPPARPPELE